MNQVASSDKDKIRNYGDKDSVINAIIEQVNNLIAESNIERSDIIGVGIGAPGPLDAKKESFLKLLI